MNDKIRRQSQLATMSDSEAAVNSGKGVGIQRAGEDGGGQGMGVAREDTRGTIMYSVDSVPPIHLTILFGFQVCVVHITNVMNSELQVVIWCSHA